MRLPVALILLASLVAAPALAGSSGSSSGGDGATAPSKIFPSEDPTAGRSGSGSGGSCDSNKAGGACVSAGSVGQVTAPLPRDLIVNPQPAPASGQ